MKLKSYAYEGNLHYDMYYVDLSTNWVYYRVKIQWLTETSLIKIV